MNDLQKELLSSLKSLLNANPRDSTKNQSLIDWFSRHFGSGRGATVNESKQASNRIKEQYAHHDEHVIFIYHDDLTRDYLLRHAVSHRYEELKTVILSSGDLVFTDKLVFVKGTSFGDFVDEVYPKVNIHDFLDPKVVQSSAGGVSENHYNEIFFGPPGTGKSHLAVKTIGKNANTKTQFHPEYSYGDFIGCYRPVVGSHSTKKANNYIGDEIPLPINYFSFVPGPFMGALVDALKKYLNDKSSPQPHYLLVDEINRGDCSSIFGDIFQLLDRNSEGFSEYGIDPRPEIKIWLDNEFEEIGDWSIKEKNKLSLPPNFIILGTMNTSDQNLYPMDTAFKRRWDWKSCSVEKEYEILLEAYPRITPVLEFKTKKYEWIALLKKLNRRITGGRQGMEDKQIGPWFIKPAADGTVCVQSFANKLLFYLWCDVFKDDQDSENSPFITHCEKGNEINTFGMLQSLFQNKGLEAIFKPEITKDCLVQSSDVGASGEDVQTSDENLPETPSPDESEEVAEQQDDSSE